MVGTSEIDVVIFCEEAGISSIVFCNGLGFINLIDGFELNRDFLLDVCSVCFLKWSSVRYVRFSLRKCKKGYLFFVNLLDYALYNVEEFCFWWSVNNSPVLDASALMVFSNNKALQVGVLNILELY